MEPIEIKSGISDIIASGTVISFKNNPIEIVFGPASQRLRLILKFTDKVDNNEVLIETSSPDTSTLEINLINFKNPLGSGNAEPLKVGYLEGRQLYINYRVYPLNEWDKTVHYTIYKGEVVST